MRRLYRVIKSLVLSPVDTIVCEFGDRWNRVLEYKGIEAQGTPSFLIKVENKS
jgi:hypothetical protein